MDYPKWHFGTSVHLDCGTFGLWYIWTVVHLDCGTFGLWYIWTLVHLDFGTSVSPLFPYCRTNGGRSHGSLSSPSCTPLSYIWGTLPWKPFQSFLHPIIVQMGDAAIDTLSSPTPAPHYRTNGGRCHRSLSSPSCTPLSYRWGTHSLWLPFLI